MTDGFDPSGHPRGDRGRFTEKRQGEADIVLDGDGDHPDRNEPGSEHEVLDTARNLQRRTRSLKDAAWLAAEQADRARRDHATYVDHASSYDDQVADYLLDVADEARRVQVRATADHIRHDPDGETHPLHGASDRRRFGQPDMADRLEAVTDDALELLDEEEPGGQHEERHS